MAVAPVRTGGPVPTSDDDLVRGYLRGNAGAFEELYSRYESRLYGFCLRDLGDRDAASDAFQETFMRVVEASGAYVARGRFTSWLFTIARRVCVDAVRAGKGRHGLTDADVAAASMGVESAEAVVERRDEIERRLSVLPPEQREVTLLHRYHGFAYSEIASITASTEAAVKQKAYRALRTLRSQAE